MAMITHQDTWKINITTSQIARWSDMLKFIVVFVLFGSSAETVLAQESLSVFDSPDILLADENSSSIDEMNATRSTPGLMILEKDTYKTTLVKTGPESLTVLILENGTKLEFIDVGNGYVGIAEYAPANATLITNRLIARWDATPLEIYLLLAPQGYNVPVALVTDHNLQRTGNGKTEEQPRALGIKPGTLYSFNNLGLEEDYSCESPGFVWREDWEAAFEGVTDYYPVAYGHQLQNAYYFYPGYQLNAEDDTTRQTYLGACNGDDNSNTLFIEIHKLTTTGLIFNPIPDPPTIAWDWVKINDESIVNSSKFLFYSGDPGGRYRARINAEIGFAVDHFGIAAAWSKTLPF